jgi:hypothetical protein
VFEDLLFGERGGVGAPSNALGNRRRQHPHRESLREVFMLCTSRLWNDAMPRNLTVGGQRDRTKRQGPVPCLWHAEVCAT